MGIQFFVLAGAFTALAFEKFIVALSWVSVDASERHQMYFLVCHFLHLSGMVIDGIGLYCFDLQFTTARH